VSLESNISLLVATFDLAIVKGIRDAIRTADLSSGKGMPVAAIGPAPSAPMRFLDSFEPTDRRLAEPVYEPRQHIHPTPVFEPRPVIDPHPREALAAIGTAAPVDSAPVKATHLLPEPPWKSVPWKNPAPPAQVLKVVVPVHDKIRSGQLIDLFI
jgi:hypothetical protein